MKKAAITFDASAHITTGRLTASDYPWIDITGNIALWSSPDEGTAVLTLTTTDAGLRQLRAAIDRLLAERRKKGAGER